MKKIYLMIAFAAGFITAQAQQQIPTYSAQISKSTNQKRCGTVENIQAIRQQNPNAESDAHFEAWINGLIQQRRQNEGTRLNFAPYNLPIIFHIIHNGNPVGTSFNVAQSKIVEQVLQLNKDYANQSNSPYSVSANTGIKFFLAQKDQFGNTLAEPGIDRVDRNSFGWSDPTTGWTQAYINGSVKSNTIWDPERYINIWLVPYMPQSGSEILGYATFPTSSNLQGLNITPLESATTAGVVLKYSVVGSVFSPFSSCSESFGQGKTLTHELGHFFGLRHIWGDANCATDYCDDTPIHAAANSGVPTHPKSNSCGTLDEMFENYMDYTDDRILNTFTQNQVDRMQTVMLNSPRRAGLATSTVGLVPATGSNQISFNDCTGAVAVSEAANSTGTYPRYREVRLYLNVDGAATGAATVNLTNVGGTAVLNRDYIFTSPSLSFAAGDVYKPITIRVLDNAAVDGNRTIVLGYTISSGNGVTVGTTAQTVTITIQDDDNIVTSQNQITILNENFEGASLPGWSGLNFIATPGANAWTYSNNGNAGGSGRAAHITNNATTRPNTYTTTSTSVVGLRTPQLNTIGLRNINVSFNYRVWGEVYNGTPFDYGMVLASLNGSSYPSIPVTGTGPYAGITDSVTAVANFTMPTTYDYIPFYLAFYWENDNSDGNNPPLNIDNFLVKGDGFQIENAVSNSNGYDVYSSTTNNYRSTNNKSVLRLSNVSVTSTNTIASVIEAGTDRPTFSTNGVPFMRSRKVITLGSTPANTTGTYTVKLYYTAAELAAWGASVSSLKVMKVNTGVSLTGDLNSTNAIIVTPTQFEDSTTNRGYYAFTATFTTGYGQYVVVANNAVLPVKLLSFTGSLEKNKSKLNWKTANEINNKGFEVERSIDGTKYEKIDFVSASATNNYELFDATIIKGNKYYYRLKQIDIDGNYTYSPVVIVNYFGENGIFVFPNPVKNNLIVQQGSLGRTSVVVTDLAGKTVYSTTFSAGTLSIDAQTWSNGVYMVRVIKNGETSNFKIMKQ